MKLIDLNCDLGEGCGNDSLIMPYISSASIACGYHAGDEKLMNQTVELCLKHSVAIGAHPSFPDRENFGRTDMHLTLNEIYDLITNQVRLMIKIATEAGAKVQHVKPHGALYNMAAKSIKISSVIALAIKDINEKLILFGLSGSHLINEAQKLGLKSCSEVFADRTYREDGRLTARSDPKALIADPEKAIAQVLQMINKGTVTATTGKEIPVTANTVCLHGDGEHAVELAKKIHTALKENNIAIKAIF
ncbi:MAG TPA: 5-oxoprolinase subunit PxpA [Chitinophagaceae bacterium]|nr:5-oxoprolinase subunit PxpA [Chitinophagaceae bacterium]